MELAKPSVEMTYCVVIPTYNNEQTLRHTIESVLELTPHLLVVDDGSTDHSAEIIQSFGDRIQKITHLQNQGKGKAIRNAFKLAEKLGFSHVVTLDSDGQHFASDLPIFVEQIHENPNTLAIGARNMNQENVPSKSSFGNKFSNFWFRLETGISLTDTQSGYRLYPISAMRGMSFFTNRFEFEIEVIVKAAWKGISVKNIPIKIYYPPGKERVTHFRPFQDFARISLLNTYFVILALVYYIPRRFIRSLSIENTREFLKKHIFNPDESPQHKSLSIGFGVFMGIFPVWGYQMLLGLFLAHLFKLNKALVLVAANISLPPLIPVIIYASYLMGIYLLDQPENELLFSSEITLELIKNHAVQYLLGATVLASIAGLIAASLSYILLTVFGRKNKLR